ncbi:hypothetical protein [Halopseudomonas maritima]|uniref:hypothetical protein n=1 Tax=Halopseudomonas maritima TaxID=2918528 RepID=UPI001EE9ECF4|nr:hypothetical protein [Halopseudomonas maritima]UJJ32441.1 hypothetical protein HV822_04545 [Halopseudomonas maritima]
MSKLVRLSVVALCAFLLMLIYWPGTSGALYYDDYSNLEGLSGIVDWASLQAFVFGGHAGPLGRPVALLSFVPFASDWPQNSQGVLTFNVVIHCLNFTLLVALGRELLSVTGSVERRLRFRIALAAALMWAVLPILASTSLIAIQRMTGMATLFGLLGLWGFLCAYRLVDKRPVVGTVVQLALLGLGTCAAVFTKESGALIPVFALLIDCFVVRPLAIRGGLNLFRRVTLSLPLVFMLFYISPVRFDWLAINEYRGFSPLDRVMTEWVIMWEYLYRGFLPQAPTAYGPFHDYYGIRTFGPTVLWAGLCWLAVIILAFVLRKRYVFFSLAVFWFLAGHLIESTSLMLELYFEHRNYVALYGVCMLLSVLAFTARGKLARVAPLLLVAYILTLATVLLAITFLWGDPQKAADSWNKRHPGSARAALHAVFLEQSRDDLAVLQEKNNSYLSAERMKFALQVLDRTKAACPDCLDIRLQGVMYSCLVSSARDSADRLIEATSVAGFGRINVTVVDQLFNLHALIGASKCAGVDRSDLLRLISVVEKSAKMNVSVYGAKILFVKAMVAQELNNIDMVWSSLSEAERIAPDAVPVLQYQVYFALEQGDVVRAEQALARREENDRLAAVMPPEAMSAMKKAVAEARE